VVWNLSGDGSNWRRDRVFLATKALPRHFRRADLLRAADQSLARLKTDHIDLYQLHWPNYTVPLDETMNVHVLSSFEGFHSVARPRAVLEGLRVAHDRRVVGAIPQGLLGLARAPREEATSGAPIAAAAAVEARLRDVRRLIAIA